MKKIVLFFALLVFLSRFSAQITFDNMYNCSSIYLSLNKFHLSGYKYVKADGATIQVYNINHSLFKTITIPPQPYPVLRVKYVSEQLFNQDTLIEYTISTYKFTSGTPSTQNAQFKIYNENGTLLMFKDSANLSETGINQVASVFGNSEAVYFDGVNTKMQLSTMAIGLPGTTLIYTLPGTIPCVQCSASGTLTGKPSISNPGTTSPVFYPNPVTDQLKLKYELPKDYKSAEIKIYDLQGKLIETFKVTDTFDFIYLPSDYNNGLYLYSLNVDGKAIKTEKIILNK
ncbi:MAG: T9SS type A sorting domain-containing protein [Bacteroidota bacterium]